MLRQSLRHSASKLVLEAAEGLRTLRRTAHLMCGVPDYDTYVVHRRALHPGLPYLDRAAFLRQQQEARYGGSQARCC